MTIIYISTLLVLIVFVSWIALYMREAKRLKGEIKHLKAELAFHLDVRSSVILTLAEKQMILGALRTPQFNEQITAPVTKHLIRAVYHSLVEKMKKSIVESQGGPMEEK